MGGAAAGGRPIGTGAGGRPSGTLEGGRPIGTAGGAGGRDGIEVANACAISSAETEPPANDSCPTTESMTFCILAPSSGIACASGATNSSPE